MKIFIIMLSISLIFICSDNNFAQKKSKRSIRKIGKTYKPKVPKPEIEDWQTFDGKDLNIKVSFPKAPNISDGNVEIYFEAVKSSIIQTHINGNFYMVEVREYPKNFLPDRNDLGENYGVWLKEYIFTDNLIIGEKVLDLGKIKAVEFVYQETDRDVLIHRAFVINQKLIQMILQMEVKKSEKIENVFEKNKEKIEKFFDSIEVLEQIIPDSVIG